MSETIINGIDVSEEIRYCNNCSNLGLDFKTGKFYCGLSNRKDELPEILSCENFSSNRYIKRLQEENKRLQMLSCANCGEKYLSPDGAELYEKNVQLQEENEELKEKIAKFKWDNPYYDLYNNVVGQRDNLKKENKYYKQALEEIREMILGFGNTPIEFKTLNIPLKEEDLKTNEGKFFDFYTKLKDKINEVLNEN